MGTVLETGWRTGAGRGETQYELDQEGGVEHSGVSVQLQPWMPEK